MKHKIIDLVDKYFWLMILFTIVLFFAVTFYTKGVQGVQDIYSWFKGVSFLDNSNFVTISTVLIGIYFSLYTYILSADSNSFFANIRNVKEYKKLINMVSLGFISSMITVLLSFVNAELYNKLDWIYILVLFILFIIIFGSLIEISIYYALIFKNDFEKRHEYFKSISSSEEEDEKLRKKLMEFLERQNYD